MIRSATRFQAMVRSRGADMKVMADKDSVEARDGPLAVETWSCVAIVMPPDKLTKAAALPRPFIQVAHQDGGYVRRPRVNLGKDGSHLLTTAQAGQVKVHTDNPYGFVFPDKIRDNGAARLNHRQVDNVMLDDLYRSMHEDRIAVMANRVGPGLERDRHIVGVRRNQVERQGGDAVAETPVGLLQRHDIGANFVQYIEDTLRPTQPVRPDALTNVIAGDFQHSLVE